MIRTCKVVTLALCLCSLSAIPRVSAQAEPKQEAPEGAARPAAPGDNPPRGPADIFNRSQQRKTPAPAAPGAESAVPPGHPPVTAEPAKDGSEAPAAAQVDQREQAEQGAPDYQGDAPVGGDPHANQPEK